MISKEDLMMFYDNHTQLCKDAGQLEKMINNAVHSFCSILPKGEENYGEDGKIGQIWISRFNAGGLGKAMIDFTPSDKICTGYIMSKMGEINFNNLTYSLRKEYFKNENLSLQLYTDTKKIMEFLGLKEEKKA